MLKRLVEVPSRAQVPAELGDASGDTTPGGELEHLGGKPGRVVSPLVRRLGESRPQPRKVDVQLCDQRCVKPPSVFDLMVPARIVRDAVDDQAGGVLTIGERLLVSGAPTALKQPEHRARLGPAVPGDVRRHACSIGGRGAWGRSRSSIMSDTAPAGWPQEFRACAPLRPTMTLRPLRPAPAVRPGPTG